MASQQEIMRQTIAGMKRANNRTEYESESDDSIIKATNRGNKLKRKARYVEEGHLNFADNPKLYKRKIDYNGYSRYIIHRNPPLVDFDGDVVDSGDEGDSVQLDTAEPEEDPYGDIKIENILMPLSSAAELPNHPSLSLPYTSKALEEMIHNAEELLHRERAMLSKLKRTLAEFQGDDTWSVPGIFQTEHDAFMLGQIHPVTSATPSLVTETELGVTAAANDDAMLDVRSAGDSVAIQMNETTLETFVPVSSDTAKSEGITSPLTDVNGHTNAHMVNGDGQHIDTAEAKLNESDPANLQPNQQTDNFSSNEALMLKEGAETQGSSKPANGDASVANGNTADTDTEKMEEEAKIDPVAGIDNVVNEGREREDEDEAEENDETDQPQHRMTTRAKAQAETSEISRPSSPTETIPFVHPFYLTPSSAHPDRSNGLPEPTASETRRILCAYVQKQEEICRGASTLYLGLLKAKRLRDTVMEWCTHEGHLGEMSDGEDWYDKKKWGLDEDLRKGEEVEDDEAITTTGKKTRNRRAAAA